MFLSTDEIPSDSLLRQFARLVAQQTKNWARLILYLGLLTADAANSQHYQVREIQYMYLTYRHEDKKCTYPCKQVEKWKHVYTTERTIYTVRIYVSYICMVCVSILIFLAQMCMYVHVQLLM